MRLLNVVFRYLAVRVCSFPILKNHRNSYMLLFNKTKIYRQAYFSYSRQRIPHILYMYEGVLTYPYTISPLMGIPLVLRSFVYLYPSLKRRIRDREKGEKSNYFNIKKEHSLMVKHEASNFIFSVQVWVLLVIINLYFVNI